MCLRWEGKGDRLVPGREEKGEGRRKRKNRRSSWMGRRRWKEGRKGWEGGEYREGRGRIEEDTIEKAEEKR